MLAGGTGGAKLARGMLDVVPHEQLVVIANTGDDIDIYGAHVSPDPDLVTFWLADRIDDRGWGLRGDTFEVMGGLRDLGVDVWFQLGDRDLAWCMERARMEDEGVTPTLALAELSRSIGVRAHVLPMCDGALRTFVNGLPVQEFLIRKHGRGPVREVHLEPSGVEHGWSPRATPQVHAALAQARAVVVGPSNPVISIWPILRALDELLEELRAPVVAVSPVVGGEVLKGPTDACLSGAGVPTSAAGVISYYERVCPGLLDGMVADEPMDEVAAELSIATLETDTRMSDAASRASVARHVLAFAESLTREQRSADGGLRRGEV